MGSHRSNRSNGVQRFGSAANLNTHLHALVLYGVYNTAGAEDTPVFIETPPPTQPQLNALLSKIIKRISKLLVKCGRLIEEDGVAYQARTDSSDPNSVMIPLQAASTTYRIASGPRAGRRVLTLVGGVEASVGWVQPITTKRTDATKLCANDQNGSERWGRV